MHPDQQVHSLRANRSAQPYLARSEQKLGRGSADCVATMHIPGISGAAPQHGRWCRDVHARVADAGAGRAPAAGSIFPGGDAKALAQYLLEPRRTVLPPLEVGGVGIDFLSCNFLERYPDWLRL